MSCKIDHHPSHRGCSYFTSWLPLQSLQAFPNLIMCIYCVWRGHGGLVLWIAQMRRMGEFNIE